jgi:membrane-bound lytic murein transglycosylase D
LEHTFFNFSAMKLGTLAIAYLLVGSVALAASLPWQEVSRGNAYWAETLGVELQAPHQKSADEIINQNVFPDPSFRLINAALKHQIRNLPNNTMMRFADSMMHVMIYLSGGHPAKADRFDRAGWWMLSYPVALRYGLKVNRYIDERLDFALSTQAAMKYVGDLQEQFKGNTNAWLHAFIESPLAITRMQNEGATDTIMRNLFAMYKVMVISDYTTTEDYAVEHFYASVNNWIGREMMLTDLVIERTGIQQRIFKALNPDLVGDVIPAKKSIKLTDLAIANLKMQEQDVAMLSAARLEEENGKLSVARNRISNNQPDPRTTTASTYNVRSGDNLGAIAARFGVKVSDIKSWNNLNNDMIYAGQKLVVYGKNRKPRNANTSATSKPKVDKPAKPIAMTNGEFITYSVKNGDTLWSIARIFPGVSPDNIMHWNGISSSIKVGQQVKILKSEIRDYDPNRYPDVL